MVPRILIPVVATYAIGASFVAFPARGESYETLVPLSAVQLARSEAGRHGPFATARRAHEVANLYRSRGFDAQVFSAGGDYYVNVW